MTPEVFRGDTGVTQTVLEPNLEPPQDHNHLPGKPGAIFAVPVEDDGFDAWWSAYPRKTAKDAARRAYRAALKRAPADVLLAGAERYRDDPTRAVPFTAYPATWLNGGRWADEGPAGAGGTQGVIAPQDEHFRSGGGFYS